MITKIKMKVGRLRYSLKAFSFFEIILTVSILVILGAIVEISGQSVFNTSKNNNGSIYLLAAESNAHKDAIDAGTFPSYPTNIGSLLSLPNTTFTTAASTDTTVISYNLLPDNTLILAVLSNNSCWLMHDTGSEQPTWGMATHLTNGCTASNAITSQITSTSRSNPSNITL